MRQLLAVPAAMLMLSGCDAISPFVGEELKATVCDRDHDGLARSSDFCGGEDCDDADDAIGAPKGWYRDIDLDTYGAGEEEFSCSQPEGFVIATGDCDDTDELVFPGGIESCNNTDDDCDDEIDEENITIWYLDADQDSYGNMDIYLVQCDAPVGYIDNMQDCDDLVATANPGGTEVCDNGIDEDCNNLTDDAEGSQIWYTDADMDGYGNGESVLYSCEESVQGRVLNATDCDDTNIDVNPSVNETCRDEIDNDCDGEVDTDAVYVAWYLDADQDGWGDATISITDCALPKGYVENAEDCDDVANGVNPAAEETCNNWIDDNCDESVNQCALTEDALNNLSDADTKVTGEGAGDNAGYVIAAGDVNDDNINDVIVGAPGAGSSGAAYILFGPLSEGELSLADADVKLTGEDTGDTAGWTVAVAGDVNNDGVDDVIVGAPGAESVGAAYILFGPLSKGELSLADADVKLVGEASDDKAGWSVASAGDMNNDGVDDVIIGAPGTGSVGAAYILFGPLSEGELSLADADVKLMGEASDDKAGWSVASAGDMNNDGVDDVIVGASYEGTSGPRGAAYILFGPVAEGELSLSNADVKLTGEDTGDTAGWSVASAGDMNNDGIDDVIVGAPGAGSVGAAYILFGPVAEGELSLSDADVKLTGESLGDNAAWSLSAVEDINSDGADDILVGATGEDAETTSAGNSYILFGPLSSGEMNLSSSNLTHSGETVGDYAGCSVSAQDTNNDGYSDLLIAAYRQDASGEDAGAVYIIYGLGY